MGFHNPFFFSLEGASVGVSHILISTCRYPLAAGVALDVIGRRPGQLFPKNQQLRISSVAVEISKHDTNHLPITHTTIIGNWLEQLI